MVFIILVISIVLMFGISTWATDGNFNFKYTQFLVDDFEKRFHERCNKYPFVEKFVNITENPTTNRHVVFVFSEYHFKNGGLGDRLGGVINAVSIALRYNRQILISSDNDLHKFLRPYHPTDIHKSQGDYLYTYKNWTSWTDYDYRLANNDATEYDLYDCINTAASSHCSMDTVKDVPQPIIKLRSNRAYLCRYDLLEDVIAHKQWRKLGIPEGSDLYEVGGCMLRLALWPTQRLWGEVDRFYDDLYKLSVVEREKGHRRLAALGVDRQMRGLSLLPPTVPSLPQEQNAPHSQQQQQHQHLPHIQEEKQRKQQRLRGIGNATLTHRVATEVEGDKAVGAFGYEFDEDRGFDKAPDGGLFQVGMHFRCGDISYIHGANDQCVWDPNIKHPKSYMEFGNPYGIGTCAAKLVEQLQALLPKNQNQRQKESQASQTPPVEAQEQPTQPAQPTQTDQASASNGDEVIGDVVYPDKPAIQGLGRRLDYSAGIDAFDGSDIANTTPTESPSDEPSMDPSAVPSATPTASPVATASTVFASTVAAAAAASLVSPLENKFLVGFLSSDNPASVKQMESLDEIPVSLVSPPGCHIELDQGPQCLKFTLTNWLALAQSDLLITQTLERSHAATSSFSRYAGIYGLKHNVFIDSKNCTLDDRDYIKLSRMTQSNWFC